MLETRSRSTTHCVFPDVSARYIHIRVRAKHDKFKATFIEMP